MDQSLFITSTHSCLTTSRATALAIAGGYDTLTPDGGLINGVGALSQGEHDSDRQSELG